MKRDNFDSAIKHIESVIGYSFADKSLLRQAFTRTSYCNEHGHGKLQSNEVLEFFGDGVLSVAIISHLLHDHVTRCENGIRTSLTEGDLSNIKSKLSDKKNLSERMRMLGLAAYLRMGEGDAKLGIENEPSVMEDLFESIIGAVYIDSSMSLPTVMNVVGRMLNVKEYTDTTPPIQSAKNALQEWCADKKRRLGAPIYKTVSEEGPDHKKIYERGVYIGDRLLCTGKGKNMKLADAAAAEKALAILRAEDAPKNKNANNSLQNQSKEVKQPTPTIQGKKLTRPISFMMSEPQKTAGAPSGTQRLKELAASEGIPGAIFKDLGESVVKGVTTYRVECLMGGCGAVGTGATRKDAKEAAAQGIIKCLSIGKSIQSSKTGKGKAGK